MSVITDRAIPSVEDGFKPVVRRILYDMAVEGYTSGKPYVKCASPVGSTMSRYHPHGDSSIYGALVNLAQPWTMRYPLIDFHGNAGSRDGDPAAAYRYSECRLAPLAEATLADIKKNTVDWQPNYSETENEPVYLPGRFPHLLCNGAVGIAVAMAASFPAHNLGEVMNAAIYYLTHKDATDKEICSFIAGPDFPTGGTIVNKDELLAAYLSGRGRIRLRGDYEIEDKGRKLVFTSIPYKVSKEDLANEIDKLCETDKINGITEIRDESNKQGVRFVIELAKGVDADYIAKQLYRQTNLEISFSINQVALVNKQPRLLTTPELIKGYIHHQEDVFVRRNKFDLEKLQDRIHILEGFAIAAKNIDEVIHLIKSSENEEAARVSLMRKLNLTYAQATAVLGLKLSRLTHMEQLGFEKELQEKKEDAAKIIEILNNPSPALAAELEAFKNKFNDARRTKIIQVNETKEEEEIVAPPEDCVITVSASGIFKRIAAKNIRTSKRNSVGVKTTDEVIDTVVKTNTNADLIAFSDKGTAYRIIAANVPEDKNGRSFAALTGSNEKFVAMACGDIDDFVWFVTKNGIVKRTPFSEYKSIKRGNGVKAINLKENDEIAATFIAPESDLLLITHSGKSIRVKGKEFAPSGRTTTGIKGIALADNDYVIAALPCDGKTDVIIGMEKNYIKRVPLADFITQGRAGKGVICAENVVAAVGVNKDDSIFITGSNCNICIKVSDLTISGRTAKGTKALKNGEIITIARV